MSGKVKSLQAGKLRNLQKFWIVNGFSKEFCHKRTCWAFENLLYLSRPIFQYSSHAIVKSGKRILTKRRIDKKGNGRRKMLVDRIQNALASDLIDDLFGYK